MAAIVGVKTAKEIAICRNGANQFSHVLLTKSLDTPTKPAAKTETGTENDDMDLAIAKAIAAMNEVTKAYFLALDDETAKAFIAKTPADQAAEAAAAKAKMDEDEEKSRAAKEMDDKAKTDTSAAITVLTQKNESLTAQLEALKRDKELDKEASDPGFNGYPGGTTAVSAMLKSIEKVDADTRKAVIDNMKAQAAMALATTVTKGGRTEEEIALASPKTAELERKVQERMSAKSITRDQATLEISRDPATAGLVSAALAEQG